MPLGGKHTKKKKKVTFRNAFVKKACISMFRRCNIQYVLKKFIREEGIVKANIEELCLNLPDTKKK